MATQAIINSTIVQQNIDKIAQAHFPHYIKCINKITTAAANFCGELYEIVVKDDESEEKINMFAKVAISEERFKDWVNVGEIYEKELFTYGKLSEMFHELQEAAQIPSIERYKMAKMHYGNKQIIIFEDLVKNGFQPWNTMEVMPIEYVELSICEIAKLHALSFILEKERPDYAKENIVNIKQSINFDEMWNALVKRSVDTITKGGDLSDELIKKVENFLPKIIEKYPKYMRGETSSVKCLIHGDYTVNNFLWKKDNDGVQVVPIDYQLIVYNSPVIDVINFIHSASDSAFRRKHLVNLKNLYFDSLKNYLKHFAVDVETVYPKETYEKDFKDSLDFGLMFALYLLPIWYNNTTGDVVDGDSNIMNQTIKLEEGSRKRIVEFIHDYIEWGIL